MGTKTIKIIYFVLSLILVVLLIGYSFLSSFDSQLDKNITELKSINVRLKETKDNINKILSQTDQLNVLNQPEATGKLLEYVDKLSLKYNIEMKETPKIDENNRTVSVVLALSTQITTKKQLEEILSYTTNDDVFFFIRDLEISFFQDKGYLLNSTVEIKNVFTKH
ncbi:hypothetical protein [Sulfurihydrogenibium azorense]|jgi:hypothetical protein|uniref:hypothetical protein n=1 Tax=Sulfurihydrogenibium azorense TaxID=309806 RepID=UPI00240A7946|nr:hypothetical protein [Sulfurihydrogenibium azorense]MDM7272942.1 hypothetical protein [Sulfurihydrogenibium azorense]